MNVMEQITAILAESFGLSSDEIHADSRLEADLGINSLELADLVLLCEERFDITIDDDDIQKFTTVGDVVAYMTEKAGN